MKKNSVLKVTCIIFSLVLIILNSPITTLAGNSLKTAYVVGEQNTLYSGQEILSGSANKYYSNNSTNNVVYSSYSLLTAREKQFYNKIVSLPVGTMEFTLNFSPYLSRAEFNAIDFTAIMYAVCLDHPEIFWYNGYSYGYSYVQSTGAVASIRYILQPPVKDGTNIPVYSTADIISYNTAMWNEFHRVAEDLKLEERSRLSFIRTIHDYICQSVEYVENDYCFDPYGTLIKKQAVCQGYSETFKMFCDYFNIPVVNITGSANGGAHMWNAVQMEDGIWYLLDITWNDQPNKIYDDFFLIGLNTKDTYFTQKSFSSSHLSDGSPYLPTLNYAITKYQSKGIEYFNQTYNSSTDINKHYLTLSPFTAPNHNVYYEGLRFNGVTFKTGSTVVTPDNKTWTVIILGDTDGDGSATVQDYNDSITRALRDDNTVKSAQDSAADICKDGVIDVLDVAYVRLMSSGSKTDIQV